MPLFEYECHGCGIRFEELVRASEAVACPGCGGTKIVKLVSRFAVGAGERPAAPAEPDPCGACGAPVRGSCAAE
jgi:putative FmdB family regulatory protein